MATAYTSNHLAYNYPVPTSDRAGEVLAVQVEHEISAALVINDTFSMMTLPAGHVVVDCILYTDDLESSGTASTLDVGFIGGNADALIDGSTVSQAGGMVRMGSSAALEAGPSTSDQTVGVTVASAPTTGATSGTIGLVLMYRAAQPDE